MSDINKAKTIAWWLARQAHGDYMYYEAAERGYEFKNAAAARDHHLQMARAYEKEYGLFDPYNRPADVADYNDDVRHALTQGKGVSDSAKTA